MDEPQPNTAPIEGAEASAQPIDAVQVEAEQPQEPAQETTQAPSEDDTAEWLSKKGFDPSDPEVVTKLAKSYRESEKLALSKAQEAAELRKLFPSQTEKPVIPDGVDPQLAVITQFAQEYKQDKLLNEFKESHSDWQEYREDMSKLLSEPIQTQYGVFTREQYINAGMMSLDDVYRMAKANTPVNTEQIKTQAQQEVLQTLANTQRAGGANAHATSTSPTSARLTKENVDAWWEGLGTDGRKDPANRAQLDRILAS